MSAADARTWHAGSRLDAAQRDTSQALSQATLTRHGEDRAPCRLSRSGASLSVRGSERAEPFSAQHQPRGGFRQPTRESDTPSTVSLSCLLACVALLL